MSISLDLTQSLALAVVVLLIGSVLKKKIGFLRRYFIPTPVIGGLLFAIIMLVGNQTESWSVELDQSLSGILLIAFFTATGFSFSVKDLKKTGIIGLKLAVLIIILVILQNALVPLISPLAGIDPLLGLTMASMALAGGPGTSAAFGPTIESMGIENATLVALSAATFGLVMGSIIGGPVAKYLIKKNKLSSKDTGNTIELDLTNVSNEINDKTLMNSSFIILISMGLGTLLVMLLNLTGFIWPDYVGGLFIAAILRNIIDSRNIPISLKSINIIGAIALNLFLALTIMDLEIWNLLNLAIPMIICLLIQTIFMMLFAIFIIYRVMGKNYDAAVMTSGMSGVGLGSTPNAVANMEAVIEENGPSPNSMIILPVVVAVFLSMLNPIIITLFINIL
ncbi:ESS family glutamate:Na+ symporter [Cytobacillus oceanisediminis]|uniref:Sodium/glutamate symporter n=1 Tax=Cytobacillus oceanisediminis TaxID=665099 RepID=A0A2V2ZU72_9BACI|nr:sodium/glutamate symporter [Cytobacillus oceanisediminis]PWW26886.1 ESS family glutamate:Na+ symporter [Cytobacillus oceanisediminis]